LRLATSSSEDGNLQLGNGKYGKTGRSTGGSGNEPQGDAFKKCNSAKEVKIAALTLALALALALAIDE